MGGSPARYKALVLLLLGVILWLPRGPGLDRFVTTDEVAWLWRSANFYYSLGQRDFGATFLNSSPGVVTMWVETAAYLLEFPEYRGLGQGILDKYSLLEKLLASNGVDPHDILITSRTIMVLLNVLAAGLAFLFAWRLFGWLPALVGFLLLAFDPFHIGITRLAHLDGPLGSFLFLSLLALLAYLHAGRRRLDLVVSAIAGGVAILAKSPALIMIPVVGLIVLEDLVFGWKESKDPQASILARLARQVLAPCVIWGITCLATITLLFPAMWVKPVSSLRRIIFSPTSTSGLVTGAQSHAAEVEEDDVEGGAPQIHFRWSFGYLSRYPRSFFERTSPVVLIGLIAALVSFLASYGIFEDRKIRRAVIDLALFVAVYTIVLTIPPKSSGKYYFPVYPVIDLAAGLGWAALAEGVRRQGRLPIPGAIPGLLLAAVVGIQMTGAIRTYPYYSSYANPFLSSQARARSIQGSGEGLEVAAEYLNQKPNARSLKVMSWYGIGPFSYYFVGETVPLKKGSYVWNKELGSQLKRTDYLVVYFNQWTRQLPNRLFPLLSKARIEYSVWNDGYEYARIYDVDGLPAEVFDPP